MMVQPIERGLNRKKIMVSNRKKNKNGTIKSKKRVSNNKRKKTMLVTAVGSLLLAAFCVRRVAAGCRGCAFSWRRVAF